MASRIRHLFVSPGHNYFGRHGLPAERHPVHAVDHVECIAGRGLRGDRFFDHRPDYHGQVTFVMWEHLAALWTELGVPESERDPAAARRNVVTEGLHLPGLVGVEFELQGVRFQGTEECRPCHWMDLAIAPGAHAGLARRGGLRARILSDGVLRVSR